MPSLTIFNNDAFKCAELTNAINVIPNKYGRVQELGVFTEKGVKTTSVVIDINNGVLSILPPGQRGGPASVGKSGKKKSISFQIPCFPHEDVVLPDEVQDIRPFGESSDELTTVMDVVLEKLAAMRDKHDITLEYMRMGALQGQIKDDEGNVLLDLFEVFKITQKVVNFTLGTATTDVQKACREVTRYIKKNLKGETMTHVHCLCSSTFFDKLIAHPAVKEAYNAYQAASPYREDMSRGFKFQDILFEEYEASASTKDGTELRFIPDGDARFFPMGTRNTFQTYFAPADFEETVNTIGVPVYAKQEPGKMGRSRDLHTQSNPLPICGRPEVLVRGYSSN